jgi:hypothetical protein
MRRAQWAAALGLAAIAGACGGGGGGGGGGGRPLDPPLPFLTLSTFQTAAVIVGQPTPTSGSPDAGGGSAGPIGLQSPQGGAGGGLFVADTLNHRVLGFLGVPTVDGAAASFVLGQADFTHHHPNDDDQDGASDAAPSARTLWLPLKVAVARGRLFVVDSGNHRVLIWDSIPTSSFVPADHVVGQRDFVHGAADDGDGNGAPDPTPSAGAFNAPGGVAAADDHLYVVDVNNNRVLIWESIPESNGLPADRVLGQPDFASNSAGTSDFQLRGPGDVAVGGGHLYVADTLNHRVLVWNSAPPPFHLADSVLGQPHFVAMLPAGGSTGMFWPVALHASDFQLFVADYGNNRVLVFDTLPTIVQQPADRVLGQSTFVNVTPNDDDQDDMADATPSGRTVSGPFGVGGLGKRLYVTDGNHRVLVFHSP